MSKWFAQFANRVAHWAGKPIAFAVAFATILVWAVSGPIFGFSDTWQLVINTGTTIVTFLMVFLIQNAQNRDGAAIQSKLDEIIRSIDAARNDFVGIEHLTEEELEEIRDECERAVAEEGGEEAQDFIERGRKSFGRLTRSSHGNR